MTKPKIPTEKPEKRDKPLVPMPTFEPTKEPNPLPTPKEPIREPETVPVGSIEDIIAIYNRRVVPNGLYNIRTVPYGIYSGETK